MRVHKIIWRGLQRPFTRSEAPHARTNTGVDQTLLRDASAVRLGSDEGKHGIDSPQYLCHLGAVTIIYLEPGQARGRLAGTDVLFLLPDPRVGGEVGGRGD